MARKNLLAGLLDDPAPKAPDAAHQDAMKPAASAFGNRGVVGAMSRSLEKMSADSDATKALAALFAKGEAVVEIDPSA
ncbi:MAG: plasmid partitioning protein RepB, partial [Alcaligenaceae bacterium]